MLSFGVVRNALASKPNERNHIKMKFAPKAHNLLIAIAAIIAVPTLAQVDAGTPSEACGAAPILGRCTCARGASSSTLSTTAGSLRSR